MGTEKFLPELWTSDVSVVDGTHTWDRDGTVAEYIPVQYAIQTVTTTKTSATTLGQTFTLTFDASRLGLVRVVGVTGGPTTIPIAVDATALDVKLALEVHGHTSCLPMRFLLDIPQGRHLSESVAICELSWVNVPLFLSASLG